MLENTFFTSKPFLSANPKSIIILCVSKISNAVIPTQFFPHPCIQVTYDDRILGFVLIHRFLYIFIKSLHLCHSRLMLVHKLV